MSRVWFAQPLETVATFCRILRRDGVTLGFTTHDRDLWFDAVLHRSAPGMAPSALRRSADLEPDSIDLEGALSDDAISATDLAAGRFDAARVVFGLVDWQTLERHALYSGRIGEVAQEDGRFTASLVSRKADLAVDTTPRTSPSCRAVFCGPGCGLSAARFSHEVAVVAVDDEAGTVTLSGTQGIEAESIEASGGTLRWLDGPQAGLTAEIVEARANVVTLDAPLLAAPLPGARAILREGCDGTLATCATRFANAINFRGEPFLPGNDFVARYAPLPT